MQGFYLQTKGRHPPENALPRYFPCWALCPKSLWFHFGTRGVESLINLITKGLDSDEKSYVDQCFAARRLPWHLRHLNPALLNRQGMSTHPKMENGSELCHWKGQLVIGLRARPVRPLKPPQIGAKLGTLRGSTTWRNAKVPPHRHVSGQHSLAQSKVINIANTAT